MSIIDTDFSAKEPSLGYIYQIKYALLLLLTNARDLENPKVKIEKFSKCKSICCQSIFKGIFILCHLLQYKYNHDGNN